MVNSLSSSYHKNHGIYNTDKIQVIRFPQPDFSLKYSSILIFACQSLRLRVNILLPSLCSSPEAGALDFTKKICVWMLCCWGKSWVSLVTVHCSRWPSRSIDYLAIDSGGYSCRNSLHVWIAMWLDVSQRNREHVCQGIKCKTLEDWILCYTRTYYLLTIYVFMQSFCSNVFNFISYSLVLFTLFFLQVFKMDSFHTYLYVSSVCMYCGF